MTPAERDAIRAAAREAAGDAPPLSLDQLEMLRRDSCPIVARPQRKADAA